jgi:hypothetical protein
MPYRSGFFGAATGCGISPKHVVVAAIIEDQKATQSSIGMTISPLSIGQSNGIGTTLMLHCSSGN